MEWTVNTPDNKPEPTNETESELVLAFSKFGSPRMMYWDTANQQWWDDLGVYELSDESVTHWAYIDRPQGVSHETAD